MTGLDDEDTGGLLLLAGLLALRMAPWAEKVLATTAGLGLTFTTTVRVVDRVHGHTADGRTNALPAAATSLAGSFVHVVTVTYLTDRAEAGFVEAADFTGRHFDECPAAIAVGKHGDLTGSTGHLTATTRDELDIVDVRAEWNAAEWHRIARLWSNFLAGNHGGADFETERGKDVGLHTIFILDEGDAAGAVRIVFDADHGCWHVILAALEVNETIVTLVTTTDVAGGDAAGVVTTAGALERAEEALLRLALRNLVERREILVACGWSVWLEIFQGHDSRNG